MDPLHLLVIFFSPLNGTATRVILVRDSFILEIFFFFLRRGRGCVRKK